MKAFLRRALLFFTFWAATPVSAQILRGRLIDVSTNEAVPRANIVLRDVNNKEIRETTADTNGVFLLRAPSVGSYTFTVTHIAYLEYTSTRIALNHDEIAYVTVRLSSTAIPMEALVVTARRTLVPSKLSEFERRRAEGTGYFFTRKEIESRVVATSTTLLRPVPGLILDRPPLAKAGGGERYQILFHGNSLAPCIASIFVDGAYVPQSPQTLDEWLDLEVIAAVEVYVRKLDVPIDYRRDDCGAVLFWTREGGRVRATSHGVRRYAVAGVAALAIISSFFLIQ